MELDIHSDSGAPDHELEIDHTSKSENFTCRYLSDCLAYLRNFHYANPSHDIVNVVVELKNSEPTTATTHHTFDDGAHTIEDFDAILRKELGDALYTPADFFTRCPGETTLTACARLPWAGRTPIETWQLEDLSPASSEALKKFLANNGVVRGHDSFEYKPFCDQAADGANYSYSFS